MADRKDAHKTKQSAHGSAEIRRSSTGHRGDVDLRERLNRNRSPSRNSPDKREGKARQTSHGDDSSPGKRIDRNVSKKRRLDDHGDNSGRMSDDKMRQTHYDKPKHQLIKEADSLTSEVHELKRQLSKEKEERERFTTNVKKFIEAHYSHLRLEDELKRSQDQIKHLVAQLEADVLTRRVFSSSEEEGELKKSQGDEGGPDSSSRKLRSRVEVKGKSPQVANAIDENVEVAETAEWFQVSVGPSNGADIVEDTLKTSCLPFPPPPPPSPNPLKAYTQYKGNNDGVDEEMVEVDIVLCITISCISYQIL